MNGQITRRRFVAGSAAAATAIAAVTILTRRAEAAEFTYKYANNSPVTHPMNIRMTEAANKIKEESKGRLEIQIFPNNQLGGDTDMLSQVRAGAIDFFTLSGLILATLVPVASINGIGFAWKSYDQIWPAMDGELGAHVRAAIAKSGLVAFDHMWDGFWFLANAKSWEGLPKDLQEIATRNINEAALKDRADIKSLNDSLAESLKAKGMVFNATDPVAFRGALKSAGFYEEWKGKYGAEAWALLEKFTGSLA